MSALALPLMLCVMVVLIVGGLWLDREPKAGRKRDDGGSSRAGRPRQPEAPRAAPPEPRPRLLRDPPPPRDRDRHARRSPVTERTPRDRGARPPHR